MEQLPNQNYISPRSQMQQLVSHWNNIIKQPSNSKKRSRDDKDETVKKQKIQSPARKVSNDPSKN
jgi:hypothetical protein